MMETAKREPQVQGRKFSLGSCLAVTWVSLPRAPRQLDISQARSPFALTMADMDFMGLLQQLNSGKPKGGNDLTTVTAQLQAFLYTQTIA